MSNGTSLERLALTTLPVQIQSAAVRWRVLAVEDSCSIAGT
jgi:hypothetical protein